MDEENEGSGLGGSTIECRWPSLLVTTHFRATLAHNEACESEPSWDPQMRGDRSDEEPWGLLHLRAREHARSLSPSPLPPSPSLCVHGCDTTWYTKPAVLFCAFLCTIISSLLALRINCWDLSMLMCVALVCSFHSHESNVTLGHTRASADRPRLLIGWNCKWSSYKKPCAQQQNISGVSTKEGNFWVLENIGCPMVLFPNRSDLLSHQQEPAFPTSSLTLGAVRCQMLHLWGIKKYLFACLLFLPNY